MKQLTVLTLAIVFALMPATVRADDDGPGARCNGHMCPVARAATDAGYKTVSALPMAVVLEGEFLV